MYFLVRLARHKPPALIAIFAILLLFVAPEVSKTLEHRRIENLDEHTISLSTGETYDMQHMTDNVAEHKGLIDDVNVSAGDMLIHPDISHHGHCYRHTSMSERLGMVHDDIIGDALTCGYCVILIHLPLIICISLAILWFTLRRFLKSSPRLIFRFLSYFFPGTVQPRAPPA